VVDVLQSAQLVLEGAHLHQLLLSKVLDLGLVVGVQLFTHLAQLHAAQLLRLHYLCPVALAVSL
jgi:hypothetical protein